MTETIETIVNTDYSNEEQIVKTFAFFPINVNGKSILWDWVFYRKIGTRKIFLTLKEYNIAKLELEIKHIENDISLLKQLNKTISSKENITMTDRFIVKQNSEKIAGLIYEGYRNNALINDFENIQQLRNLKSRRSRSLF